MGGIFHVLEEGRGESAHPSRPIYSECVVLNFDLKLQFNYMRQNGLKNRLLILVELGEIRLCLPFSD